MVTVATSTHTRTATQARRRVRLHAQRMLWTQSSIKRIKACGKNLASNAEGVQLRVTHTPEGKRAGFAGVQRCGSVWACPMCSAKVLGHRQTEIATAVDNWTSTGGQIAMLTFTMRHNRRQDLKDLWDGLSQGWKSVSSGREYMAERERYGVETTRVVTSGKRAGQTVPTHVLPFTRVAEVTHGDKGWHVHLHVLLYAPASMTPAQLQELYVTWWKRWNSGLESLGITGSKMVNTAEFINGKTVSKTISDYFTKNTYVEETSITAGNVAGLEIARGDLKNGRFGNRAAMEILRDLVNQPHGPERAATDGKLWAVYELASKGRRQMTWARGSREILGLDVEVTDEEIADEEIGTEEDAVINIPADSWKAMRLGPRMADLLETAERPNTTISDVEALLDEWGMEWVRQPRP